MNIRYFLSLIGLLAISSFAFSLNVKSFEKVDVSTLGKSDLQKILSEYEKTGKSIEEFDEFAVKQGLSKEKALDLQKRLQQYKNAVANVEAPVGELDAAKFDNSGQPSPKAHNVDMRIFGADLFLNKNMSFAPNQNMPTPVNYQLGPGDALVVDVYGYSETTMHLTVASDGSVRIPNVGPVQVSGSTIEQATVKIRKSLSAIYSTIASGKTQIKVTLSNIKSINVYITGSVRNPGTYTLSSLSTVYNALYACAGPSNSGSMRSIKVVREGKQIALVDLYAFLVNGSLENNITLKDQDVIHVPSYGVRVEIEGALKHPGFFEMKEGETLMDLLSYAGGFTERAYQSRITVERTTNKERSVADVSSDLFSMFTLQTGDKFTVSEVLDRFTNRVQINGSVFRPGPYALDSGMTLNDLVKKADGLLEDAYMERATVTRLRDDLTPELISFNVQDLIDGKFNLLLKREDAVTIGSNKDLEEKKTVSIYGQVLMPGVFAYYENMTVKDLIFLARGFKEFAETDKIELSRKVKDDAKLKENVEKVEVKLISVDRALVAGGDGDIVLEPNDQISVRLKEGIEPNKSMSFMGEVRMPGDYVIINKRERISDILARAGGLTSYAYAKGAFLLRNTNRTMAERLRDKQLIEAMTSDDAEAREIAKDFAQRTDLVGIKLDAIVKHPGGEDDVFVENGDMIFVPRELQTVTINGKVQMPGMMLYKGRSLRKAVRYAGGFTDNAYKRGTYVAYPNGDVKGTRRFLWWKNYPNVTPGAHVYIPEKEAKDPDAARQRTTFAVTIFSSVISAASVAVSAIVCVASLKK